MEYYSAIKRNAFESAVMSWCDDITLMAGGAKKPLDEGESGECKSWLKPQH